jgi:hypothetical protein
MSTCEKWDVLTRPECFLHKVSPEITDPIHAVKVRTVLVSQGQWLYLLVLRTKSKPFRSTKQTLQLTSLPTEKCHTLYTIRGKILNLRFDTELFSIHGLQRQSQMLTAFSDTLTNDKSIGRDVEGSGRGSKQDPIPACVRNVGKPRIR